MKSYIIIERVFEQDRFYVLNAENVEQVIEIRKKLLLENDVHFRTIDGALAIYELKDKTNLIRQIKRD